VSAALDLHRITKTYRGNTVVDDVSLRLEVGERMALLGVNGAGKTTTLLISMGLVRPDGGTVQILGHTLPHGRAPALANVGFAAGYQTMPGQIRVLEYLRFFGRLYGVTRPDTAARWALDFCGVADLAKAVAGELSSGQKTIVGIAKALIHRPRLLILDEPTGSLDPDVANRIRACLLSYCANEGAALLATSHNMVDVERLCERIVFMAAGRVIMNETPEALIRRFGGDLEQVFLQLAGVPDPPIRS
jgi:ABC-2 type transport system ATP-binding protein